MTNFVSDFSLFPIKKLGRPGWEFRKATWPSIVDPEVHKLIDDNNNNHKIKYLRKKIRDGTLQQCIIIKEGDKVIMKPGDGWDFIIRKDSENNKEYDIDNANIPHDIKCLICLDNKRTHMIPTCFHVVACAQCAFKLYQLDKKECPICRVEYNSPLQKLFF